MWASHAMHKARMRFLLSVRDLKKHFSKLSISDCTVHPFNHRPTTISSSNIERWRRILSEGNIHYRKLTTLNPSAKPSISKYIYLATSNLFQLNFDRKVKTLCGWKIYQILLDFYQSNFQEMSCKIFKNARMGNYVLWLAVSQPESFVGSSPPAPTIQNY